MNTEDIMVSSYYVQSSSDGKEKNLQAQQHIIPPQYTLDLENVLVASNTQR